MQAPNAVPWRDFAAEVLSLYAPPIRRPGTYRKTRQVLGEFSRLCKRSDDLAPAAIAAWVQRYPDRGASTRLALLRTLRPVCTYGASAGYLVDPFLFRKPRAWLPASALSLPESDFRRHRTAAEIRSVLAQADSEALGGRWESLRLRAAIYTWCFTGARKSEILGSTVADYELEHAMVSIRGNIRRPLKTAASSAKLPIAEPLAVVLADWLPRTECQWAFPHKWRRGPWLHGPHGLKALDQVAALGRRAGVPGLTILSLRHSFGTLSEGWGFGGLLLQRFLRHTAIQTQQGYRHQDLDQLRCAAAKIRYDGPN
jgi:integrase